MQPSPETNKPPSMPNVEYKPEPTADRSLKGYSTFFGNFFGSFYHSPRVKQLGLNRQFLVSLTSIVGKNILWKSMRPETVWLLIFF